MSQLPLILILLWLMVDHCQASVQTCNDMGLYFCAECEDTALSCHSCTRGYTVNVDMSGCLKCTDLNCLECSVNVIDPTVTDCELCKAGYYLNVVEKTCVSCGISNCDTCHIDNDNSIVCDSCAASYYKISDNQCGACDPSCLSCTATSCITCKTNETVVSGADASKCVACPTSSQCTNCVTGDTTTPAKCTACLDGYYVSNDACVACNVSSCKTCVDDSTCDVCDEYYYRTSDTQCLECGYKCMSCEDTTTCAQCEAGFAAKNAEAATCDACPANCEVCNPEVAAVGQCTVCATGFVVDSVTKQCVACASISNCLTCTSASGSVTCNSCANGFILADNACYKCPDNCASCVYNTTIVPGYDTYCEACSNGYTVNSELQCSLCSEGCRDCIYNSTAIVGYDTYCEGCKQGYTITTELQCAPCGACAYCSWNEDESTVQCVCKKNKNTPDTEADDEYRFLGFCDTDEYACQLGYFYTDSTDVPSCLECPSGCKYCNTTSECFECFTDQGNAQILTSDGTCYRCTTLSPNCVNCSGDGDTYQCDGCSAGFYVDGAGCSACPANCAECTDGTSCTTCMEATVKGSDGNCYACPDNCGRCEYLDGFIICSDGGCDTSYQKLASDQLCHACPNHCTTCTESATTSDVLVCSQCAPYYTLNAYTCAACPANCEVCSASGSNIACSKCNVGYYLDSAMTCQSCVSNCAVCKVGATCDQCLPGYGLTADRSVCTACASLTGVTNCAICTDATSTTAAKCTSCTSGYAIKDDGTECLSTASFGPECLDASDWPPTCSQCQDVVGVDLVDNKCLINCTSCGIWVNAMPTSTVEECNVPGNVYTDTVQCLYGCTVMVSYQNGEMVFAARGCIANAICLSDGSDQCVNNGPNQTCSMCCNGYELCNDEYYDPSSAPTIHHTIVSVLMVTVVTIYVGD